MVRSFLSALAGYVVMAVTLMVLFSVYYFLLGTDGAYQPGTYEVTATWLVGSFILGLIAAVAGGWVCARVGRGRNAVWYLIGIVVVLGAASAIAAGMEEMVLERVGEVGLGDAMSKSIQPPWVAWTNIFVGVAGVLLGARVAGSKPAAEPAE